MKRGFSLTRILSLILCIAMLVSMAPILLVATASPGESVVMAGSGDTPGHADISGDSVIDRRAVLSTGRINLHDLKQGATVYTTKAATGTDGSVKTESTVAPYLYTWKLNTSATVAEAEWIFFQDDFEDYTPGENSFYTANASSTWYQEFRNTESKP